MPGLRSAPDAVHTLRLGRGRARLGPWPVDPDIARLVASPDAPLDQAGVLACVDRARSLGFRGIITNAMTDAEAAPYLRCDFVVHEHLHLLAAEVAAKPPPTPTVPITRVRRREHDEVLVLDAAAFPRDWRLGPRGPHRRARRNAGTSSSARRGGADDAITGYAITGIAGPHGYLQRIAADPERQREGIGRALVLDSFAYLWSHGASRAYVNTQLDNAAALALYQSCGFRLLTSRLTVLERSW